MLSILSISLLRGHGNFSLLLTGISLILDVIFIILLIRFLATVPSYLRMIAENTDSPKKYKRNKD